MHFPGSPRVGLSGLAGEPVLPEAKPPAPAGKGGRPAICWPRCAMWFFLCSFLPFWLVGCHGSCFQAGPLAGLVSGELVRERFSPGLAVVMACSVPAGLLSEVGGGENMGAEGGTPRGLVRWSLLLNRIALMGFGVELHAVLLEGLTRVACLGGLPLT